MINFKEYFPNDFIHLLLAAFSAEETGIIGGQCPLKKSDDVQFKQETEIYKFMKEKKAVDLNEHLKFWSVSEIIDDENTGYLGLILENQTNRQLVLSHRSTNFKLSFTCNLFKQSGVQCDIRSVVLHHYTTHQAKAYQATQKAVEKAKQLKYSLSFCGHSLGAWLAELSVYYCHAIFNPSFPNVKAVTFDGPGSFEMMQLMDQQNIKGQSQQFYEQELDIVFYLSAPNMINCMNSHIGIGYRLYQENFDSPFFPQITDKLSKKLSTFLGTLEGHDLKYIIPVFDHKTGKPNLDNYSKIKRWPSIKYSNCGEESNVINLMLTPFFKLDIALRIFTKIVKKLGQYITVCSFIVLIIELIKGNIKLNQFWNVQEILKKTNQYKPELKDEEEFDLLIKGSYQMNIPNDFERDLDNQKQIDHIDEYLITIQKESHRIHASQCKRYMKQMLIQISNIYEYKKQVFRKCIKIKEKYRNEINITILRDQIRILIRDHMEDFEVFLNENQYFDDNKIACFFNRLYLYDENYVQRKELKDIENAFSKSNVVVITGPSKFGKTTLAYQYARKLKDQQDAIVIPFNAENQSTFYSDLQYYHHHLYHISNQKFTFEYLLNDVWAKMQNINQQLIIIFDNLKDLEIVQTFLANLKQHFKIIITTINNQIFIQTKYEIVNISAMTEQECLNYIDNTINKRKLDDKQKKILIHSSNSIPLLLNLYIFQLNNPDNMLEKTEQILANLQQYNNYSQLIEQIQDDYCIIIMQYISWLYPNQIEMHLIQQLLQNHESDKENKIQKSLIKLANQGFINILENQCIRIDNIIQEECRKLEQSYQYLSKILMYFYNQLPDIENEKHNVDALQIALNYHLHVKQIITLIEQKNLFQDFLKNNLELFQYSTIITLKLSIIYQFLLPDYQSCQQYLNLFGEQYFQAMKNEISINLQALIIAIINNTKLFLVTNKKQEALQHSILYQIIQTEIFDKSPNITVNMYLQIAILYQQYQQYDLSNKQLEKLKEMKCVIQGNENLIILKILMIKAENFQLQKQYNGAFNLYQNALKHLKTIQDDNKLRDVYIIKAKLFYQLWRISFKFQKDSQQTQEYFEFAIKLWQEKPQNIESLEIADFQYNLGLVFKQMKRYDESFEALENAYQQKRKIIGEEQNDQCAQISYQKGVLMMEMNKINQAQEELIQAQNLMLESDNFKLKSKIEFQLALIYKYKGLKFQYIKALEELISNKRNYYAYIDRSIINDILYLADAYEEFFKDTAKQTILYQLIYFITILHQSQIQYYQQKNLLTGLEEQVQFKAFNRQSNTKWLSKKDSQNIIKRFQPNFFDKNLSRTLILRSGIIIEEEFQFKQILQTSTLNQISQLTYLGRWKNPMIKGVSDFISRKHLKKKLKEQLYKNQNFKIVLMLCFEAINIGIVQSNFQYIQFANRFITKIITYPQMQNFLGDVIQLHPEYFIDGKILQNLITEKSVLKANLGNEEKLITSNKEISNIIFSIC